jgi:hypothetical protein
MINTKAGEQLAIPHSFWYFQFDNSEIWNGVEPGKTYDITIYGYRIPALGVFPNIIRIEPSAPASVTVQKQ